MKIALIGINAKYIHQNLAIRLLKANTTFLTTILEYTIKGNKEKIIKDLENFDILAFSCYIWNIEIIKQILTKIDKKKIVILGGPEVSYNPYNYIPKYADYIIKNEGEESFHHLISFLKNKTDIKDVPNLYYNKGFTYDKYVELDKLNFAYELIDDVKNRIIYVETSRGCPFKCSYCMASLDNKLRFFSIEKIKKELLVLINKGAKTIKFLDRTFNANKKYFLELLNFLIENHKKNSFQFEITGDLLDEDIIEYINTYSPKDLFRFEIGIQSTNRESNLLVNRIQNNEKLFRNISLIQKKNKINLHLDLIAGLPNEDYDSFKNTFNEVLALRPLELQLGFLKVLHGTELQKTKEKYGYIFSPNPPYEIISNNVMSKRDLDKIRITEDAFDRYYNSKYLKRSMNLILDNIDNYYEFFYDLGKKEYHSKGLDYYFSFLDDHLKSININNYFSIHKSLLTEYLTYFNLKPKAWWYKNKETFKRQIRDLYNKNYFDYSLDQLYNYSILIELDDGFIFAIYLPNKKEIFEIKKESDAFSKIDPTK